MDENFNHSLKCHHLTSAGFASSRALLTPWSPQVPAPLSQFHGAFLHVVANYVEAYKHSLQLLEALTKIFPPGDA